MIFSKYRNPDRFSYLKDIFDKLENSIENTLIYYEGYETVEYRRDDTELYLDIVRYNLDSNFKKISIRVRYTIKYLSNLNKIYLYKYNDIENDNVHHEEIASLSLLENNIIDIECEEKYLTDLDVLDSIYKIYDGTHSGYAKYISNLLQEIDKKYSILNKLNKSNKMFIKNFNKLNINSKYDIEINKIDADSIIIYIIKDKNKLIINSNNANGYIKYNIKINDIKVVDVVDNPKILSIFLNTIKKEELEKIYSILEDLLIQYNLLYNEYLIEIGKDNSFKNIKEELSELLLKTIGNMR